MLSIAKLDFGAPTGTLELRFVDKGTGAPQTVRASVQLKKGEEFGKYLRPSERALLDARQQRRALLRRRNGRPDAACGEISGPVHFGGMEYREARVEVNVAAGREAAAQLDMERWTDPPGRGWWGGESHIHANYGYGQWYNTPATVRLRWPARASTSPTWWWRIPTPTASSIGNSSAASRIPFDARHVVYWNEEFRATLWGHMTLLNLKRLVEPMMTGFQDTTNPWDMPTNADIADDVHLQGGHVNYTHSAPNARDPFLAAYAAGRCPWTLL